MWRTKVHPDRNLTQGKSKRDSTEEFRVTLKVRKNFRWRRTLFPSPPPYPHPLLPPTPIPSSPLPPPLPPPPYPHPSLLPPTPTPTPPPFPLSPYPLPPFPLSPNPLPPYPHPLPLCASAKLDKLTYHPFFHPFLE